MYVKFQNVCQISNFIFITELQYNHVTKHYMYSTGLIAMMRATL